MNNLPEIRRWLDDLQAGRNVTVGEVVLAANPATSTTKTSRGCSSSSCVTLTAMNAGAAAIVGTATGVYVVPGNGEFVINHPASAANCTFRYVVHTGTAQL